MIETVLSIGKPIIAALLRIDMAVLAITFCVSVIVAIISLIKEAFFY